MSALERLKQRRQQQQVKSAAAAAGALSPSEGQASSSAACASGKQHLACNAHVENDGYMQRFEESLSFMEHTRMSSREQMQHGALRARPGPSSNASQSAHNLDQSVLQPRAMAASSLPRGAGPAKLHGTSWRTGPLSIEGQICQLSDRNLICSAARWKPGGCGSEIVLGSADHALYVVDAETCQRRRTLFSKTCGHKEWVTSVTWLPDGRILSGGMDGALWLWAAGGCSGVEIRAHSGPVSQVRTLPGAALLVALSSSYDKTVCLWDVSGLRAQQVAVLAGLGAPVLELEFSSGSGGSGAVAIAGDRGGSLMAWDVASISTGRGSSSSSGSSGCSSRALSAAKSHDNKSCRGSGSGGEPGPLWSCRGAHDGHVTALAWAPEGLVGDIGDGEGRGAGERCSTVFLSGGQDGCVRAWDVRAPPSSGCVAERRVHVTPKGKGAVGGILAGAAATAGRIVTTGADGKLCILEPRMSLAVLHNIQLTDFPYSLAAAGGLAFCGCGAGSLQVVDLEGGQVLYALGANKGAVRTIDVSDEVLLCGGDDGTVITYSFV